MHSVLDWKHVARNARELVRRARRRHAQAEAPIGHVLELDEAQCASVEAVSRRLVHNGVILADEVGMGKTRIAVALASSVVRAGGRVAIVAPPGLDAQWRQELARGSLYPPELLRTCRQFLQAWEDPCQPRPWTAHSVVLLSHGFNRSPPGTVPAHRWTLLPELLGRLRLELLRSNDASGYKTFTGSVQPAVRAAAASIIELLRTLPRNSKAWQVAKDLNGPVATWRHTIRPAHYARGGRLRPSLERVTGLGLGLFDLVIIDEAHKSRGEESMLSSLLGNVLLQQEGARRLAMSATPVELDPAQWKQSLARIAVPERELGKIYAAIDAYVKHVAALRRSPHDCAREVDFVSSARTYRQVLKPYLLRRDKREDVAVRQFAALTSQGTDAYRNVQPLHVTLQNMSPAWRQAVCAAEALSFAGSAADDGDAKRQRLTFGNGHGIARLIDAALPRHEADEVEHQTPAALLPAGADRRAQRVAWWKQALGKAVHAAGVGRDVLYSHPALNAAVHYIESVGSDEKVLVFGRYLAPMQVLANLLNARAMLRALEQGKHWPQQRITAEEELAVQAAHHALYGTSADLPRLSARMQKQYKALERSRHRFRQSLLPRLQLALALPGSTLALHYGALLSMLQGEAHRADGTVPATSALGVVARALSDHLGDEAEDAQPELLAATLVGLLQAAANQDPGTDAADQAINQDEASAHDWAAVLAQLHEGYAHSHGGYARLLHGRTKAGTRRLLQLAFNRANAHPRVLIAQSLVGREGLNLHLACRTVLLLHLEWNPAVVEQQIGRVDRMGSLWQQKLAQVSEVATATQVPRIEVRQVVFEGTYDEGHWQLLQQRWEDLRAQLHGDILPRYDACDAETLALRERIARAAPNFSPVRAPSAEEDAVACTNMPEVGH